MDRSADFADLPDVALPDHVYVPVAEVHQDMTETTFELRELPGAEVALVVYSSLDELVARCGEHQPWILLPGDRLDDVRQRVHFDRIVLDLELGADQRHQGESGER